MTYSQTNEFFSCGDCKHHLRIRENMHKVICSVTLEFKDRKNVACCKHAERRDADDKTMLKGTISHLK